MTSRLHDISKASHRKATPIGLARQTSGGAWEPGYRDEQFERRQLCAEENGLVALRNWRPEMDQVESTSSFASRE